MRLYGFAGSEGSFGQVTRGLVRATKHLGLHDGLFPLDTYTDAAVYDGFDAAVSLNIGPAGSLVAAQRFGRHQRRWWMLAPNGEALPRGIEVWGQSLTGLATPSAWGASVLRRRFKCPIVVVPHGITPEVHTTNDAAREFRRIAFSNEAYWVLHLTSATNARKGTPHLLEAWARALPSLPSQAALVIIAEPGTSRHWLDMAAGLGLTSDHLIVTPGLGMSPEHLAAIVRAAHWVCQPSRGEGFGMVPLEALCCGTPVIATTTTGHSEYLMSVREEGRYSVRTPGLLPVETGPLGPLDDFEYSMAPELDVEHLADVLRRSVALWSKTEQEAADAAGKLRQHWAWENAAANGLRALEDTHR